MTFTPLDSLYEAPHRSLAAAAVRSLLAALALAFVLPTAQAQTAGDTIVEAREAFRKKDRNRLAAARAAALAAQHPLAMWAEYWDLTSHLSDLQQPDLDAFYARWPGSYVEDRLRND